MNRYDASSQIINAVLKDLSMRNGLDVEVIINDSQIYEELQEDLISIVDDILFEFDQEKL